MLIDEFLCKREVLGKRAPHSFTPPPPLSVVGVSNNFNRKKRELAEREGLESDEEEVEDIHAMEHLEEILCATYERKTRGAGSNAEASIPV
jgi:hypothetical protein